MNTDSFNAASFNDVAFIATRSVVVALVGAYCVSTGGRVQVRSLATTNIGAYVAGPDFIKTMDKVSFSTGATVSHFQRVYRRDPFNVEAGPATVTYTTTVYRMNVTPIEAGATVTANLKLLTQDKTNVTAGATIAVTGKVTFRDIIVIAGANIPQPTLTLRHYHREFFAPSATAVAPARYEATGQDLLTYGLAFAPGAYVGTYQTTRARGAYSTETTFRLPPASMWMRSIFNMQTGAYGVYHVPEYKRVAYSGPADAENTFIVPARESTFLVV